MSSNMRLLVYASNEAGEIACVINMRLCIGIIYTYIPTVNNTLLK